MKIAGRKIGLSAFAFPVLLVLILFSVWFFRDSIFSMFKSSEHLRAAVERTGTWGPLAFVALQALQVIVFVLPGEITQIAGGYLFGVLHGTLLSVLGIGLGSLVDFAIARVLGVRFVAGLFGREKLARFDALTTSPRAEAAFFLLFVIPGIPKDLLCFVAGLSTMGPLGFLSVSMIGRLPGIVGSVIIGEAASDGRHGVLIGVSLVAIVLFAAGLIWRQRIHDVIVALIKKRDGLQEVRPPQGEGEKTRKKDI